MARQAGLSMALLLALAVAGDGARHGPGAVGQVHDPNARGHEDVGVNVEDKELEAEVDLLFSKNDRSAWEGAQEDDEEVHEEPEEEVADKMMEMGVEEGAELPAFDGAASVEEQRRVLSSHSCPSLSLIPHNECPADSLLPKVNLYQCHSSHLIKGDLCEGDTECGTTNGADNCNVIYDVYRVGNTGDSVRDDPAVFRDEANCPALRKLKSNECVASYLRDSIYGCMPNCNSANLRAGDVCEADNNVCGTSNANNCGAYDVYKVIAKPLYCVPIVTTSKKSSTTASKKKSSTTASKKKKTPVVVASKKKSSTTASKKKKTPVVVASKKKKAPPVVTTKSPSMAPTMTPTRVPSKAPTPSPTVAPTPSPSPAPSAAPTLGAVQQDVDLCRDGIMDSTGCACCPKGCGVCGGCGCAERGNGADECCPGTIIFNDFHCMVSADTACILSKEICDNRPPSRGGCPKTTLTLPH